MSFEQSVLNEDYSTIKSFINDGIDINKTLSTGFPPISELITPKLGLQIGVQKPNQKIIKLFIENGVDINRKPGIMPDNTPLIQASYYGFANIVYLLLKHGANIDKQNGEGATALMMAAMAGNIDIVKILMAKGADQNIRTFKLGMTALDGAYRNNNLILIELLES